MSADEAKEYALDTCINVASLDISCLIKSLKPFKLSVIDYDNLTVNLPGRLPNYHVWLKGRAGYAKTKARLRDWITSLPPNGFLGSWFFVVGIRGTKVLKKNFEFDLIRYANGMTQVRRLEPNVIDTRV